MTWPAPMPCGCPTAGLIAVDEQRHIAYHEAIGGRATCAAICWCGQCPQYAAQAAATALLREQEYAARDRRDGERAARKARAAA